MIAIEVSSAARRPPLGGIATLIRYQVEALLRVDPETPFALCYTPSRWRKQGRFEPSAGNARLRVLCDPFNRLLIPRARLLHSMSSYLPRTPRIPKLAYIYDLTHLRHPEWVGERQREWRLDRLRVMVRRADHIVTQSAYTSADVCAAFGLGPERVHTVPGGVDASAYHPLPAAVVEETRARYGDYVVAIGLLTPRKNFPVLVEAVSRLEGVRLVVIGRRAIGARDFDEAVERFGMRERVLHRQDVPHDELLALINGARVFAVPSLFEGFGLVLLEAMACGVPVVCSDRTSFPEVAGNGALLVDASKPEALAEALSRVIHDPALAARLAREGLARARQLSWDASARELRALYRRVAGV